MLLLPVSPVHNDMPRHSSCSLLSPHPRRNLTQIRPLTDGRFREANLERRLSAPGRGCVKTHLARRVGSLTGELELMSRLKLHLRG